MFYCAARNGRCHRGPGLASEAAPPFKDIFSGKCRCQERKRNEKGLKSRVLPARNLAQE